MSISIVDDERELILLDDARNVEPTTPRGLWNWVFNYLGVKIPVHRVCLEHCTPWDWFRTLWFQEPDQSLCHASRGSGKSFLDAIHTHMRSRFRPRMGTRILGGSLQQSAQIYNALAEVVVDGKDADTIKALLATNVRYRNKSHASILPASPTSVRGPHVPDLKIDEVDEMKPDIFDAAIGMAQDDIKRGYKTTIVMSSTHHNQSGTMGRQVEKAEAGAFPLFRFCTFEVLERCPEWRSGPHLENCPQCPIQFACWEERFADPSRPPKAKLSDGHYSIRSLIQKANGLSRAAFASDFLCRGPKLEGLYFPDFTESANVSDILAKYDPRLNLNLAIDTGHHTAAVLFQVAEFRMPDGTEYDVRVLADYYVEDRKPYDVGLDLIALPTSLGMPRPDHVFADPAGDQRHGTGVIILGELERAGVSGKRTGKITRWPNSSVADSVALVQALVRSASGQVRLHVHPRCVHLIRAMRNYRKASIGGHWLDRPQDPQHPSEDLVDALRGGLKLILPAGRKPQPKYERVPANRVF